MTRRTRQARPGARATPASVTPPLITTFPIKPSTSGTGSGSSPHAKNGPEAIAYAEIGEWQRLTGTPIRPEEVDMLMQMDDAFLVAAREEQRAIHERANDKSRGGRK